MARCEESHVQRASERERVDKMKDGIMSCGSDGVYHPSLSNS